MPLIDAYRRHPEESGTPLADATFDLFQGTTLPVSWVIDAVSRNDLSAVDRARCYLVDTTVSGGRWKVGAPRLIEVVDLAHAVMEGKTVISVSPAGCIGPRVTVGRDRKTIELDDDRLTLADLAQI